MPMAVGLCKKAGSAVRTRSTCSNKMGRSKAYQAPPLLPKAVGTLKAVRPNMTLTTTIQQYNQTLTYFLSQREWSSLFLTLAIVYKNQPNMTRPTDASPPLLRLPLEILNIIAGRHLSPRDRKALRLTHSSLGPAMVMLLFRRVFLSKTKLDHDSFFNIAQTPRLAVAVRELVWYELAEDATVFQKFEQEMEEQAKSTEQNNPRHALDGPFGGPAGVPGIFSGDGADSEPNAEGESGNEDKESASLLPPFRKLAQQAFWLFSRGSSEEFTCAKPMEAIKKSQKTPGRTFAEADFLRRLFPALDAMPDIHTFVSCPMPPWRTISKSEYPLTAEMFRQSAGWSSEDMNDGFFSFMAQAMRRPSSTIRRLAFADESISHSSLCRLRPSDIFCFQKLTHVDLCLGSSPDSMFLRDAGVCLRAATDLVDLRICLENCQNTYKIHPSNYVLPIADPGEPFIESLFGGEEMRRWPRLRRLELIDVPLIDNKAILVLVKLLRAHVLTLRHLALRDCCFTRRLMEALAKVPHLNLASLQVNDSAGTSCKIVSESQLVAYVNGEAPAPANPRGGITWDTSSLIFDPLLGPTAAMFDAAIVGDSLYSREDTVAETGSSTAPGLVTEALPRQWFFNHPSGQYGIGDDPLEFFSDWEISSGGTSEDDDEELHDFADHSMEINADDEVPNPVHGDGTSDVSGAWNESNNLSSYNDCSLAFDRDEPSDRDYESTPDWVASDDMDCYVAAKDLLDGTLVTGYQEIPMFKAT